MDTVENHLDIAGLYEDTSQVEIKLTWECIGHDPTTWGLGILNGNVLQDIKARTIRKPDGSWDWFISVYNSFVFAPYGGNEPNRILAMTEAENHIRAVDGI